MKYLIDANLPYKLAIVLKKAGYEVIHTDELPNKERTTDREIKRISSENNYIVITKDFDFLDSFLIQNKPEKLLLITTGNIKNKYLLSLFKLHFDKIHTLFSDYSFIELNQSEIRIQG